MAKALIGSTGFVGSNLLKQIHFDLTYRSTNINKIRDQKFKLVVCAGAPGTKWIANQKPKKDLKSIQKLIKYLDTVQADSFVLISSVDVYPSPKDVDENTLIDKRSLHPYGRNRLFLEEFVRETFSNYTIIRLPGLFGPGIKKNFIYDLIHNHALEMTDHRSVFQFYNLNNLWKDISIALSHDLSLINFATEPVKASNVAWVALKQKFVNKTNKVANYNMKTVYGKIFDRNSAYLYDKSQILNQIKAFIRSQKDKKR